MADDKEVEKTIAEDLVVTKYKLAGQIVNRKFCVTLYECFVLIFVPVSEIIFESTLRRLDRWTRVIAMRTMWCRCPCQVILISVYVFNSI